MGKLLEQCKKLIGGSYPVSFLYNKTRTIIIYNEPRLRTLTQEQLQSLLTSLIKRQQNQKSQEKTGARKKKKKIEQEKKENKRSSFKKKRLKGEGSGERCPYNLTQSTSLAEEVLAANLVKKTSNKKVIRTEKLFTQPYLFPQKPIPYKNKIKKQVPNILLRNTQTQYILVHSRMYQLTNELYTLGQSGVIKIWYYTDFSGYISEGPKRTPLKSTEREESEDHFNIEKLKGEILMFTCGCSMGFSKISRFVPVRDRLKILTHFSEGEDCGCSTFSTMGMYDFNLIRSVV